MIISNDVSNIRKEIMAMNKPFCLIDLYLRLEKVGITDRESILTVLDELYDEGLVEYAKIEGMTDKLHDEVKWAFRIV